MYLSCGPLEKDEISCGLTGFLLPSPLRPSTQRKAPHIMSTLNITADQFEDTVLGDGIVLVDFWADWCGPCKSFAPVYEASSEKHDEITFAKVDTEKEQELSGGLGIQSIPTIMAFRDGVQVFSQPGALPEAALEDLIGQIEALDMEAIHKEIAEHQAEHAHDEHEHGPSCNH